MKRSSCLLSAAVILLFASPALPFCFAPQPRLVCAEYFRSQLVLEARLVRTRALHDKDDPDDISAYVYTVQVNQLIRGSAKGQLQIYEGNDSGHSTFGWVPRTDYLLFLSPLTENKGMWGLDGCGNSGPLSKAATALADIAKVKSGTNGSGMIQGVVNGPSFVRQNPSSAIHIDAKGASGLFHAVTNEKGEFQIKVPAGKYVVSVNEPGLSYRPFEFTYEDPDNLQVQPGGCGQVQFVDQ